MELARSEAMLFKFGCGTGTDLSTLRSHREKLAGGGKPCGPLSFMRVYDQVAAVVKSGGKTRRAAKMQSHQGLASGHDGIHRVQVEGREEGPRLIEKGGYESNFNGEAYSSIMFQNANLSVRVTDDFMQAVEKNEDWTTHWVTDPKQPGPTYPAREIMDRMADCAWHCGDPGVQYDTTINRWHTCPNSGRINAVESVQRVHVPRRHGLQPGQHQPDEVPPGRRHVRRRALPGGLPDLLHRPGNPGRSRQLSDAATSPRTATCSARSAWATRTSAACSWRRACRTTRDDGPRRLRRGHRAAARCGQPDQRRAGRGRRPVRRLREEPRADAPRDADASRRGRGDRRRRARRICKTRPARVWDDVLAAGRVHGFRNAQATVLAPTGTISFMMDCDTTGIEPDIALVKYKQLAGGGMLKIVNQTVPLALETLGYDQPQIGSILAYIDEHDTIEGSPDLKDEHLAVFDCAFTPRNGKRSIAWQAHVLMMAAAQPFLSGAISKTVNMPRDTTPRTSPRPTSTAGSWASRRWRSIATARRKASRSSTSTEGRQARPQRPPSPSRAANACPTRGKSITHKFNVAGHEGYITVGLFPDGRPGELFITMAKEGSTIGGLMDAFGTASR